MIAFWSTDRRPFGLLFALVILFCGVQLDAAKVMAAPATEPTSEVVHVVQPGDTLYSIAQRYRVTLQAMTNYNAINSAVLHPGERLVIPPAGINPLPTSLVTYIVQPGDTVEAIAARYGIAASVLQHRNRLDVTTVTPGRTLLLPTIHAPGPPAVLHLVQDGETTAEIARQQRTTVAWVQRANPSISTPLHTGQSLWVPIPSPQAQRPPTDAPQVIEFSPGTVGAVVKNSIQRNQPARYLLQVEAHQTLYASMLTYDQFAYITVWGPDGKEIPTELLAQRWGGHLEVEGEYLIEVVTSSREEEYFTMSVMLL